MSFRLKPGAPPSRQVGRLMDRQLDAAIARLDTPSAAPSADDVHEARKHVKKARASLRLVRSALGGEHARANHRLRTANRLLGPVADASAVVALWVSGRAAPWKRAA